MGLLEVLAGVTLAAVWLFVALSPRAKPEAKEFGPAPRLALLVPVSGSSPEMAASLKTLLNQEYLDYCLIFAAQDESDPAWALVSGLIAGDSRARLVAAGQAESCGQKNWNLLAALANAPDDCAIFVFCDANHLAPPDFLAKLSEPLRRGQVRVATGYRVVEALSPDAGAYGLFFCVHALRTLQNVPYLTQPWGGGTAISREAFAELGVAGIWQSNVVDDVSLSAELIKRREACAPVPGALLLTKQKPLKLPILADWLTRQLLYLKYIMPGTFWPAALALPLCLTPYAVALTWLAGLFPFWLGLVYLAGLGLAGLALRRESPAKPGLGPWLTAFFGVFALAGYCYLKAALTSGLTWRGIHYQLGLGGRVLKVDRP